LEIFSQLDQTSAFFMWATVGLRMPSRNFKGFTLFNDIYKSHDCLFNRSPSSANKTGFEILVYLEKPGLD
jgi:hypothetical protein